MSEEEYLITEYELRYDLYKHLSTIQSGALTVMVAVLTLFRNELKAIYLAYIGTLLLFLGILFCFLYMNVVSSRIGHPENIKKDGTAKEKDLKIVSSTFAAFGVLAVGGLALANLAPSLTVISSKEAIFVIIVLLIILGLLIRVAWTLWKEQRQQRATQ